jgi:hypothetical protein
MYSRLVLTRELRPQQSAKTPTTRTLPLDFKLVISIMNVSLTQTNYGYKLDGFIFLKD